MPTPVLIMPGLQGTLSCFGSPTRETGRAWLPVLWQADGASQSWGRGSLDTSEHRALSMTHSDIVLLAGSRVTLTIFSYPVFPDSLSSFHTAKE